MQYLDYKTYREIGGILDEAAFSRNIDKAQAIIDTNTHNRIESFYGIPSQVKSACRDLVEYLANNTNNGTASVSHSAGGVSESVTFKAGADIDADIDRLLCFYLSGIYDKNGIPVLYRGAR